MPKLTLQMTLHLNGGNKFSELHYKILADGKETGITKHVRTNGKPKYIVTNSEFHFNDEVFDLMKEPAGAIEWIEARLSKED